MMKRDKTIRESGFGIQARKHKRGAAIIIVLSFIVLLTGIILSLFIRSLGNLKLSESNAEMIKADLLAQGAVEMILGDLKQEIVDGSGTPIPFADGSKLYLPSAADQMVPQRVGTDDALPNLIKRSADEVEFYTGGIKRASAVSTSDDPSLNGRSVSTERWNKAYLLPKAAPTSSSNAAPITQFVSPDWVYVARDGSNPTTFTTNLQAKGSNPVLGRYAYCIYDEGGLLDANVAGYPSTSTPAQAASKVGLAYADLSLIFEAAGFDQNRADQIVDQIVGWRNYASAAYDLTQNSPVNTGELGDDFPEWTWNAQQANNFFISIFSNTKGFLSAANAGLANGQSDRFFSSRQELMKFLLQGVADEDDDTEQAKMQNALHYLATFTRDLNQPSFAPDPLRPKVLSAVQGGNPAVGLDDKINPNYLAVRVQDAFARNDHDSNAGNDVQAVVGEPLVKKRFALNRLAWLTCKGPSANRNTAATSTTGADGDIGIYKQNGITTEWLNLGTAANIQKYFGLNWNGSQWLYNIHNGDGSGKGSIMRVEDLASQREPDFFELLKSAINVGSLGKSLVNGVTAVAADTGAASQSEQPYNYNYDPERSVDRQIIQIGANMINQSRPDNFPVQIVFDDGVGNRNALASSTATTVVGVADLPYLYYVLSGVLQVKAPSVLPRSRTGAIYTGAIGTGTAGNSGYQAIDTASLTDSGVGAIMQIPALWNPHDPASPRGVDGPTQFRVVADSTMPDQIGSAASYSRFFAYATSSGTTVGSGDTNRFSYKGIGPNSAWYNSASQTGSEIANAINANNNEITFTANNGAVQLFPEPTMLLRAGSITDSNGNAVTVGLGGTPLMSTDPAVSAVYSSGGLPNYIANATRSPSSSAYPTTTRYLGFYLAAFPWAWNYPGGTIPLSGAQSGTTLSRVTGATGGSFNSCYLTYRIQCKDAFGNWITYDTKYGKASDGELSPGNIGTTNPTGALLPALGSGFWATVTDPRTSRFGIQWNGTRGSTGVNNPVSSGGMMAPVTDVTAQGGWLDYANGILKTNRPDAQSGFYFMACWRNTGMPTATSGWMAWISSNSPSVSFLGLAPGLLAQNNTDIHYSPARSYGDGQGSWTHTPNYFADPDGIVRRGMGAFVPIGLSSSPSTYSGDTGSGGRIPSADTTVGLPVARAFGSPPNPVSPTTTNYTSGATLSQAQSRPYFLHRPFRSVAELGCVFSDTPWRNLDFFTSESGNTALLDVFCITDTDDSTSLVAGKVNLNTRQQPVLKAVLAGTYLDPANVSTGAATGVMSTATADKVVSALTTYINTNGPVQNLAELVGKWKSNAAINSPSVTATPSKTPLAAPFYDGKLSYAGFSGGEWDSANHKPKVTSPAADVYSAYMGATSDFSSNTSHNGTQETAAYIQRIREAPIRALTSGGQTRVWNLLIDVVAQTGGHSQSAGALEDFMVEGEQRYWVHVAIDRLTGQVIDKQIEVVKE